VKRPLPWMLLATIIVVALTRLLPHPPNFSPVVALALFGGAAFANRKMAFVVPLAAMLLADLFIGFHNTMVFVYLAMALVVVVGLILGANRRPASVVASAVVGSTLFFLVTNTGMWWLSGVYPAGIEGLLMCYVAALPFFHNTLLATLLYGALLFGFEYFFKRQALRVPIVTN
jgi:hypothetical protein